MSFRQLLWFHWRWGYIFIIAFC